MDNWLGIKVSRQIKTVIKTFFAVLRWSGVPMSPSFNNRIYMQEIYLFTFTGVFLIHDHICSHLRDVFIYIQRVIFIHIHHREPEHFVSNKNECTVIYLCPCVFFESFRRDLKEAKAVSCNVVNYLISSVNVSHLPLCLL